ncbi:MAG: hypothetical protein LBL47_00735, partial [Lactobacillus sp.]|nr:hypothetical protein [Lactobacillus sp.]
MEDNKDYITDYFKDIAPGHQHFLDTYDRVLKQNNIERTEEERFLDKMYLRAKAVFAYNISPKTRGNDIEDDAVVLRIAKTNWNTPEAMRYIASTIYSSKRDFTVGTDFDMSHIEDPEKLEKLEKAQTAKGKLYDVHNNRDGWVRKFGHGYFEDRRDKKHIPSHRFILNVSLTPELFEKLDDFAEKYRCEYKSAPAAQGENRADTVLIYTKDQRINEQIEELKPIVEKFVRHYADVNHMLDGKQIANGLYIAKEADRNDILILKDKIEYEFPAVGKAIQSKMDDYPTHSHPLSLGQYESYKILSHNLLQFRQMQKEREKQKAIVLAKQNKKRFENYAKLKYGEDFKKTTNIDDVINSFEKFKKDFAKALPGRDFNTAFNNPKDTYLTVKNFQKENNKIEAGMFNEMNRDLAGTQNVASKKKMEKE